MTVWAERFVKALDSHQGARVVALMASEFRWEDLGAGLVFENADALVAFIAGCDAFSTDYRFTLVSEQVSEVDYALEWEMAGTNTGTFRGRRATNKQYCIRGASIGRFDDDGQIKENRGLLQRRGAGATTWLGMSNLEERNHRLRWCGHEGRAAWAKDKRP